jgi:hypothetical protein
MRPAGMLFRAEDRIGRAVMRQPSESVFFSYIDHEIFT